MSNKELVDRYLFGPDWASLSPQDRETKLSAVPEYPNCCLVNKKPMLLSYSDVFLNSLFFNRYSFEIETYFPRKELSHDQESPYIEEHFSINACGTNPHPIAAIVINEVSYRYNIKRITKFWDEHTN